MLTPYDLGNQIVVEDCEKIKIDELVSKALKKLKISLVEAQVSALGVGLKLTFSDTKFNGKRIWFVCPSCNRRVGTIIKNPIIGRLGCRSCMNLKYRRQRFKGMVETQSI